MLRGGYGVSIGCYPPNYHSQATTGRVSNDSSAIDAAHSPYPTKIIISPTTASAVQLTPLVTPLSRKIALQATMAYVVSLTPLVHPSPKESPSNQARRL